eukprot:CAMPEP_0202350434 /NCGR_PEP_ID=MMETSP1126-20121109/7510_1 /ASSEMBLY_ACC=CAM_ASM_000457 /TAXON_ID=3047 /ORGANISM="Dunaliella tertiolecta, Strain CCMP1320" /LENGTH=174 /DNA_ID=CAMNT_0048942409 /DNA_START=82 /DNA_END=607 /DNA_ORIENTATION=-
MGSGGGPGRRNLRERKVSQRMAVVDDSTRQQATEARLEALEADNDVGNEQGAGDSDDEEFMVAGDEDEEEEVEMSGKRKKKKQGGGGTKRKLRAGGLDRGRAPKSFQRILEESMLERLPQGIPCYTNAAAGPPWLGRLGSSALYVATYPRTSAHVVAAATAVGDATPRILRPDA